MENVSVLLLGQGGGAGISGGTVWALPRRRRAGPLQACLRISEGDRAKSGSEGRLQGVPHISKVAEVGGRSRGSVGAAQADPGGHGGVRA